MEEHIGKNIRKIRKLREYSQEYMSSEIGISKKMLCRIENGECSLSTDLLGKIADFLKIEVLCLREFDTNEFLGLFSRLCHLKHYLEESSIATLLKKMDFDSLLKNHESIK